MDKIESRIVPTPTQIRNDERQHLQDELVRDLSEEIGKCFAEPMPAELFAAQMLVEMIRRDHPPGSVTIDDEHRLEDHLNFACRKIQQFGRTDSERREMLARFAKRVLKSALSSTFYTLQKDDVYKAQDIFHSSNTHEDTSRDDGQC